MKTFFFRKALLAFMAGALITLFASGASAVFAKSKFSQDELAYMPAVQLIELFKKGETTPSEVLEAQISRVKKYNGEYNVSRRDLQASWTRSMPARSMQSPSTTLRRPGSWQRKPMNAIGTALRAGLKGLPSASRTRMKSRAGVSTPRPFS